MSQHPWIFLGVLIVFGSLLLPVYQPVETFSANERAEAAQGKESCKKCKFVDCIKATIENKQALMDAYNQLAAKWGRFWTSSDSGQKVELTELDWGKMNEASKKTTLETLMAELKQYKEDVEQMSSRIGPPKGCGYEFSSGGLEMQTDPLECKINTSMAEKVQGAVPCKELYEIAYRHETLHLQKCQARTAKGKLLTPAGLAREEAEGYAQEIEELKQLLKKLVCKGKLSYDMKSSVAIPQPVGTLTFNTQGTFPFEIDKDEKIHGDGSYSSKVQEAGQCTLTGYDKTYEVGLSGDAAEDSLQFKFTPKGQATMPSIRITCPKGYGFSLPSPSRPPGEVSIAREDGATKEVDMAEMTRGTMQGKAVITLHAEPKETQRPVARTDLSRTTHR